MHTLKNQFIVLPNAEDIVDISVGNRGKTSDINLWRESRDKFAVSQKFIGDKAYIGEPAIVTPYKKPKNAEVSELQKTENQQLSSRRIGVEHLIRRVKIFRVASDKFRLARHRYNQVILTVCGLVRLRLNRLTLFSFKSYLNSHKIIFFCLTFESNFDDFTTLSSQKLIFS